MKKLKLIFLALLLLFTSDAFAQTYVFGKNRLTKVYSTTFTAANARVSYVDGTAFVDASGLDLSAYVGTDVGSTPYLIRLEDASGDVAWGYAGAVGAGETLGSDLVVNGDMELDSDWSNLALPETNERSNVRALVGTYSRHMVDSTPSYGGFVSAANFSMTIGRLYKALYSYYLESGVFLVRFLDGGNTVNYINTTHNTVGSWQSPAAKYYVETDSGSSANIRFQNDVDTVAVEFYIDEVSVKQVTDCSVTGLHIMSAKNGTTRNWASIGANFGYNDAMKIDVYRVY